MRVFARLLGALLALCVLQAHAAACPGGQGSGYVVGSHYGETALQACSSAYVGGGYQNGYLDGALCYAEGNDGVFLLGTATACSAESEGTGSGTTIQCNGTCTVTITHDFEQHPLLGLSLAEASQITGAILLVWAAAWAFRMLIRALRVDEKTSTFESET